MIFRAGVSGPPTANALAAKYGFTIRYAWEAPSGFAADMSEETLAAIRCEPAVAYTEDDAIGHVASSRTF